MDSNDNAEVINNVSKSVNINHIFNNQNDNKNKWNSDKKNLENNLSNVNNVNMPSDSNNNENSDLLQNNKYGIYEGKKKEPESIKKSPKNILDEVNKYKKNFMVKKRKNPLKINLEDKFDNKMNAEDDNENNNNIEKKTSKEM